MVKLPMSGIEAFLAVAEHGSVRRAAGALGVQSPAVSYQLKSLEDRLGTPLFTRTTRSVRLTDAGQALLIRARPVVAELSDALEDAKSKSHARSGTLRLTLSFDAYVQTVARNLAAFQKSYPEIELELSFNEAFVDIVHENFHAGIRLGDLIGPDMIAVRVSPPQRQVIFGSPSYFDTHGRPQQPSDLLEHNCIQYRYIASQQFAEWEFHNQGQTTAVDVRGNLIVNNTRALIASAVLGLGLGWLFHSNVEPELQSGQLECVLERFSVKRPAYYLYFPKANARLEVLRVFIDFMKQHAAV